MFLQTLSLLNFRNYTDKKFSFPKEGALVSGPNMSGKSNLLEALSVLSLGSSLRAQFDREVVALGTDYSKISGEVIRSDGESLLEVNLDLRNSAGNRSSKSYSVNGVSRSQANFAGRLNAVIFTPEDINLIISTPSTRRKYLNTIFAQCSKKYRQHLINYQKVLINRNSLLKNIREGLDSESSLEYWDTQLVSISEFLCTSRQDFFEFTKQLVSNLGQTLNGSIGELRVYYKPSIPTLNYLQEIRSQEILAGSSLTGPHRDDFGILWGDIDIAPYGSRGQQRTAVFILKLAELAFIEDRVGDIPILLLDDLFSELDAYHRGQVLEVLDGHQVIMTTADSQLIPAKVKKNLALITL